MEKLVTRPCSTDATFEYIDFDADGNATTQDDVLEMLSVDAEPRRSPLSADIVSQSMDQEGRLVNEYGLRKAVYLGGVDPCVRKEVWGFLFGLYPCSSTAREREILLLDYFVKYEELKSRWKKMLVAHSNPSATPLQQGLIARYQIETSESPTRDNSSCPNSSHKLDNDIQIPISPCHQSNFVHNYVNLPFDLHNEETKQQIDFMKIQAQVYVNRHKLDMTNMRRNIRYIDKDVPRTDRDYEFFKGHQNPHLTHLRDMLITFSTFNSHIGYAQGMNDIIARFLVVFNTEFEAYWCFKCYMDCVHYDFSEEGMVEKIRCVRKLLEELDPELIHHFNTYELGDLLFCHRWLLLGFKREFSFPDSLRCFEILSCHHMELSSLEGEKTKRLGELKEFENEDGVHRPADQDYKKEFTFELFMCVGLLIENRTELLMCTDAAMVFHIINNLKINLDDILCTSEKLFYRYCKKTVEDCFLMVDIDTPSTEPL